MKRLQIVPHNTNINFIGFRFISFTLAAFITVASLAGVMFKGLNYGIDFKGGYILEVRTPKALDITKLREEFNSLKLGEVMIQQVGSDRDLLIKLEHQHGDQNVQTAAIDKIKSALGTGVDYRKIDTVGPKVGAELVDNAIKAITLSLIAMLIYIAVRFEWQFAICAIVALAHDCFAILGLFSLLPSFEFNETAIIAVLITAGYSINDTIVIFDRIREGLRKYKKMDLGELINKSLNETLSRTTMTATTTLLAVIALYLFGGKVISAFSLPILVGIIIGSFSSICLAAPLLMYLKIKRGDVAPKKGVTANENIGKYA